MFDYKYTIAFDSMWRDDLNEIMRLGGIYIIQNEVNDKIYVGSAKCFYRRFQRHKRPLELNMHWNKHLQHSFNKYGASNFSFNILEVVKNVDDLYIREQHWLDELDTIDDEIGYNNTSIAGPTINKGKSPSIETRKKISKALTGRVGVNKGVKWSSEVKQKISEGVRSLKSKGYILPQCRPVEFYNVVDDETEIFESISEAAKYFKAGKTTFKKYSHTDMLYRDKYLIKILK